MRIIEVVAAIIAHDGAFLCVQRGPHKYAYVAHKFEFPGGKVEAGETPEAALVREIREELAYEIEVGALLMTVEHVYPDFKITLHGYSCTAADRALTLTEHVAAVWLPAEELASLDWAAADLPIVWRLQELSGRLSSEALK